MRNEPRDSYGHRQSLSSGFPVQFSPERLTLPFFFFFKVWIVGWEDVHCLRAAGLCTRRAALRSGDVSSLHGMLMVPPRAVQHGTGQVSGGRASEREGF